MWKPVLLLDFLPQVTWFLGVVIAITMAIITHLVQRNLKGKDERLEAQDDRIKKLEREIEDLQAKYLGQNQETNKMNLQIYNDINLIKISLAEVRIILTK